MINEGKLTPETQATLGQVGYCTYQCQSCSGHKEMIVGLSAYQEIRNRGITECLQCKKHLDLELVIARYNENLDWLDYLSKQSVIYNKGEKIYNEEKYKKIINLPNVGRESHTYLYHIINNYNNLAEQTLFCQGNIDNSIPYIMGLNRSLTPLNYIDSLYNEAEIMGYSLNQYAGNLYLDENGQFKNFKITSFGTQTIKDSNHTLGTWYKNVFTEPCPERIPWYMKATFCISRNKILTRKKSFYQDLIKYLYDHPNPEVGHFFERTWVKIFNII